jgi:hypothetical protein
MSEAVVFSTRRPFAWGVLVVGDVNSRDIPALKPGENIAATSSTVVVRVRHAQDVADIDDSEFAVSVRVATGTSGGTGHEAVITVTSGQLSVGDANTADLVKLQPGMWRLSIVAEPND